MTIYCLHLKKIPVYEQLLIEEKLIRADHRNYFIINHDSPEAIVMGISSNANELIDLKKTEEKKIPIIRRYSGGGTVIIEKKTLLTSFILDKHLFPHLSFPEPLLKWSGDFYSKALKIKNFQIKEQDYALNDRKCAGNAQYITKDRLVHHTSFLWDYSQELMDLLHHPKKAPIYREKRSHKDFLSPLHPYFSCKMSMIHSLIEELKNFWEVVMINEDDLQEILEKKVRISTHFYEKNPSSGLHS